MSTTKLHTPERGQNESYEEYKARCKESRRQGRSLIIDKKRKEAQ